MRSFDVIVAGGSFAGLSAAMQLARARRRVLVIDAGRPRNRFAHASHGFLGQDGRNPADIIEAARSQVLAYPTAVFRLDEATHAEVDGDEIEIRLASGGAVRASRLVLATGVVDELSELPGLRERWGRSVLHCPYCHGYEVGGRRLGVLAIGEASIHQALLLPDWSPNVTLFPDGTFSPNEDQRAALAARGVGIDPRRVLEVVGDGERLGGLRVADSTGSVVVALDALFTGSRTRMASPLAERLGCALDEGPFGPVIRTDAWKQTSVPHVFAAGDIARVPHNATWASADGVTAGIGAHRSLALG